MWYVSLFYRFAFFGGLGRLVVRGLLDFVIIVFFFLVFT